MPARIIDAVAARIVDITTSAPYSLPVDITTSATLFSINYLIVKVLTRLLDKSR